MSEIRNLVEAQGARNAALTLLALLESGHARYDEFNLHDLATAFLGSAWHEGPMHPARSLVESKRLLETGGTGAAAVNTTAFKVVTSQIMLNAIMAGLQDARLIGDQLVRTVPTRLLGPETIAAPESIKGGSAQVKEAAPYPKRGFVERTQTTPEKIKQGLIVQLTKELITAAQSGLANQRLLQNARNVGFEVRYDKELRILRAILGLTNTYVENGVPLATYYAQGDPHPFANTDPNAVWVNKVANNLTDHTDVNRLLQVFNGMKNPATGRPALVMPDTYLVMPAKEMTANLVLKATEVRLGTSPVVIGANPVPGVAGQLNLVTSMIARQLLVEEGGVGESAADEYQVMFERGESFWYMEVWGPTVSEAPSDHPDNFEADVVSQFKASEYGQVFVANPRSTVLATNE